MDQNVLYRGQRLTLTRFWATGEPCLWITDPEQIGMPKMEFVGGHGIRADTDHIPGRRSAGCKRRTKRYLTGKDKPYGTARQEHHASPLAGAPGD